MLVGDCSVWGLEYGFGVRDKFNEVLRDTYRDYMAIIHGLEGGNSLI